MGKNDVIEHMLFREKGNGLNEIPGSIAYMVESGKASMEGLHTEMIRLLDGSDPGWELLGTDMIGCADRAEKIRKELGMEKPAWESAGVSSFRAINTLHYVRHEAFPELKSILETADKALDGPWGGESNRKAIGELKSRNIVPSERELKILKAGNIPVVDVEDEGVVTLILENYFLGLCTPGPELVSSDMCDGPGGRIDRAYAANRKIQDSQGRRENQRIPIARLMAEIDHPNAVQFLTELIDGTSVDKKPAKLKRPEKCTELEREMDKRAQKLETEVFNAAMDALLAVGGPSLTRISEWAIDKIFENEGRSVDGIQNKPFGLLGASLAGGVDEGWLEFAGAGDIGGRALSLAIKGHNERTQREREEGDEHYNTDFNFSKVAGIGAPVSVRLCSCVREFLDGEELDKYETRTLLSLMHGVKSNSYSLKEWKDSTAEMALAVRAIAETSLAVLGATDNELIAREANDALAMLGNRHMRVLAGVLQDNTKLKAAYEVWLEERVVDLGRYTSFVASKKAAGAPNMLRRSMKRLPGKTA